MCSCYINMCYKKFILFIFFLLAMSSESTQFRFMRKIQAIGHPYYKILMALGSCKDRVIYHDQKIYGAITLNRVLDINFKCDKDYYKVSRVEIILIINNTSSVAYSEGGVGSSEFAATLYLPTNVNFVIYALTIFTCSRGRDSEENSLAAINRKNMAPTYMPFLRKKN